MRSSERVRERERADRGNRERERESHTSAMQTRDAMCCKQPGFEPLPCQTCQSLCQPHPLHRHEEDTGITGG